MLILLLNFSQINFNRWILRSIRWSLIIFPHLFPNLTFFHFIFIRVLRLKALLPITHLFAFLRIILHIMRSPGNMGQQLIRQVPHRILLILNMLHTVAPYPVILICLLLDLTKIQWSLSVWRRLVQWLITLLFFI